MKLNLQKTGRKVSTIKSLKKNIKKTIIKFKILLNIYFAHFTVRLKQILNLRLKLNQLVLLVTIDS